LVQQTGVRKKSEVSEFLFIVCLDFVRQAFVTRMSARSHAAHVGFIFWGN